MSMEKRECDLCGEECDENDIVHLSLYVRGSEGINACLQCRLALTEYAQTISRVAGNARMQGFKRGRKH